MRLFSHLLGHVETGIGSGLLDYRYFGSDMANNTTSFMFAASRNLYALAITGHAPKVFARCSKRGIPYFAVCAVFAFTMLSFLLLSDKSSVVCFPFNYAIYAIFLKSFCLGFQLVF